MGRTPPVTLAVLATLAIGIGANTAIFTVVNGVLIKPLPYPDADRLVSISLASPVMRIDDLDSAAYVYLTQRDESRTLEGVGLWSLQAVNVTGREEPERVVALRVTADILPVLGVEPLFGRYLTPTDDEPGRRPTAVLMVRLLVAAVRRQSLRRGADGLRGRDAPRHHRRDAAAIPLPGRTGGGPDRAGAARSRPGVRRRLRLAEPRPSETGGDDPAGHRGDGPPAAAAGGRRLSDAPGFTRGQLDGANWQPVLMPLKQDVVGDAGNTLWVVMATLGLVLLVACANVANLILVPYRGAPAGTGGACGPGRELGPDRSRAAHRERRARPGGRHAGRGRCVHRLAGPAGPWFVHPATDGRDRDQSDGAALRLRRLLRLARCSSACCRSCGTRGRSCHRRSAPRRAGRAGDLEHLRARGALVVVQVALALALLVSAGLMIRTFRELARVNPGFTRPDAIQTMRVTIPPSSQPDPELTVRRQEAILEGIAALHGVESAAYASELPMQFGDGWMDLLVTQGGGMSRGELPQNRSFHLVSPGYFATMGTSLVAGRDFSWADVYERRAVALISEDLARREWGSPTEALGKRLRGGSARNIWREVVGVVGNVHNRGVSAPAGRTVYLPALVALVTDQPAQLARSVSYVLRSDRTGTPGFLADVQRAVWAIDPALPLADVRTMGDYYGDSLARTSLTLVLLAAAGAMALLLGVIGIYGVVSYAVAQRTREVGIRMALGAPRSEISGMFLRQGLVLTLAGVAVGLAGAVGLARWMSVLLFGVSPLDPATYVSVSAALIVAAGLASYLPSRRATHLDPIVALRDE